MYYGSVYDSGFPRKIRVRDSNVKDFRYLNVLLLEELFPPISKIIVLAISQNSTIVYQRALNESLEVLGHKLSRIPSRAVVIMHPAIGV